MASSCHHLTFCHDVSKHNELGTLECCHLCPPTGTEVAFSCCAVHVLINDGSTKVSVLVEMYRMHMSYPSSIMLVKRLHQSTVTLARTRNHAWPLLIWLLHVHEDARRNNTSSFHRHPMPLTSIAIVGHLNPAIIVNEKAMIQCRQ